MSNSLPPYGSRGTYGLNSKGKMVLFFSRDAYMALPEHVRRSIGSAYRFHRSSGTWVSVSSHRHLAAEEAAKLAGLVRVDCPPAAPEADQTEE